MMDGERGRCAHLWRESIAVFDAVRNQSFLSGGLAEVKKKTQMKTYRFPNREKKEEEERLIPAGRQFLKEKKK